jgi:hypothetical protein
MIATDPVGTIGICASCGYAIEVRHDRWHDEEDGRWHEADFWYHFARNMFTAHYAEPKRSIREMT